MPKRQGLHVSRPDGKHWIHQTGRIWSCFFALRSQFDVSSFRRTTEKEDKSRAEGKIRGPDQREEAQRVTDELVLANSANKMLC